ncbi:SLOG family protein [Liquorilactobacillus nagelii]|jgi:uncharacterized phage-like protein YoqJ|uniref:SLOG family protein n=1 Tax=Liquorilactobacillus nagelii TaxID=82688 RepID=UPI0006F0040E|nr:SLOG family protein [Liquorilactobacillus nagelii]KRL41446.1 hypothetical protein FD45_GL000964 [Liquorilactobacillus nagelii DSM 13675]QYH54218.1 DUF1273 family protein [Liquorilactobacillus nagelii DSM 13675]
MKLWLTGYRNYEMNIFQPTDRRIKILRELIKEQLQEKIYNGLEWLLIGGEPGIEQWGAEAGIALKKSEPSLKIALMLPYKEFGNRWKPERQDQLSQLKSQVDFVGEVSQQSYTSPQQLRNWQQFMLKHTDEALMIYDLQYPGKSQYAYQAIKRYQDSNDYNLDLLDMDWLEVSSQDYLTENTEKDLQ